MVISYFHCSVFGEISLEIKKINFLFDKRKLFFSRTFNLNKLNFDIMASFKNHRGGFLIEIKSKKKILGFFSITKSINKFYELGDLAKINKKLPRSSLVKSIKVACKYFLKKNLNSSIYTYPNHFAKEAFLNAGFKIYTYYKRNIYLNFFNYFFLIPFQVYKKKIYFHKKYFQKKKVLRNLIVTNTRLSLFGFPILRKLRTGEITHSNKNKFGLLYDFEKDKKVGDYLFVLGVSKKTILPFGFEYSDNSA